jgi:chromosome segregation ATPase
MASGQFDSTRSSLPIETQALLLEVSNSQSSNARAIDVFESMRISARKLLTSIEAEVARQGSAVATEKDSIRSLSQSLREERERQRRIREDIEEKTSSVSDMNDAIRRQRNNAEAYGHRFECCDDAPHCDALPDMNRYEASLDRDGCFYGRGYTPIR